MKWAEILNEGPFSKLDRAPRGKGAKAEGLKYEWKLYSYLKSSFAGNVLHQPWIHFEDKNGPGWACPDFILSPTGREKHKLILDAKLTATWRAEVQLQGLYLPLLSVCEADTEFTLVQVSKNMAGQRTEILRLDDVIALPPGKDIHTWHWVP